MKSLLSLFVLCYGAFASAGNDPFYFCQSVNSYKSSLEANLYVSEVKVFTGMSTMTDKGFIAETAPSDVVRNLSFDKSTGVWQSQDGKFQLTLDSKELTNQEALAIFTNGAYNPANHGGVVPQVYPGEQWPAAVPFQVEFKRYFKAKLQVLNVKNAKGATKTLVNGFKAGAFVDYVCADSDDQVDQGPIAIE